MWLTRKVFIYSKISPKSPVVLGCLLSTVFFEWLLMSGFFLGGQNYWQQKRKTMATSASNCKVFLVSNCKLFFFKGQWMLLLVGGFKDVFFSSQPGEMIQFHLYFSNGLKPPTSVTMSKAFVGQKKQIEHKDKKLPIQQRLRFFFCVSMVMAFLAPKLTKYFMTIIGGETSVFSSPKDGEMIHIWRLRIYKCSDVEKKTPIVAVLGLDIFKCHSFMSCIRGWFFHHHHFLTKASNIFYFHPYLGKIPILTNIFQMGWNHQLKKTPTLYAPRLKNITLSHRSETARVFPLTNSRVRRTGPGVFWAQRSCCPPM